MCIQPELLVQLTEALSKPGIMSPIGRKLELQCQRDMKLYFVNLGRAIAGLDLEQLASQVQDIDGEKQSVRARHFAEHKLDGVLRRFTPVLLHILALNLQSAYAASWKLVSLKEAAKDKEKKAGGGTVKQKGLDEVGPVGHQAADWAAKYAAKQVKGINKTTRDVLSDLVSQGIEDRLGVEGLGRLIRGKLDGFTVARSNMIATTEMNQAMSTAQLDKMKKLSVEYKQLILAPEACEICQSIQDAGPVPVDEPFVDDDGEEYDSTPIHPNCRCATVPSRPPVEAE